MAQIVIILMFLITLFIGIVKVFSSKREFIDLLKFSFKYSFVLFGAMVLMFLIASQLSNKLNIDEPERLIFVFIGLFIFFSIWYLLMIGNEKD